MTSDEQREAILAAIEKYTKRMTVSKAAARRALIAEGIYTKSGKLAAHYGGGRKKPATRR
ncbi:MAG TPA: hypothetical protein VGG48_13260 [Rhizomicrobium sp.]|jgi:hypothetical protein